MTEQLLSIHQIMERFNWTRAWVYYQMKHGDFPRPLQITRGNVRWKAEDIQAYIEGKEYSTGRDCASAQNDDQKKGVAVGVG